MLTEDWICMSHLTKIKKYCEVVPTGYSQQDAASLWEDVLSELVWYPVSLYYFPACDYLGERMASLFGITSAKYQYAIDEYYRMKKEVCCREVPQFWAHAVVLDFSVSWCLSLSCPCVRGRKRKRKPACQKKQSDPSTSYNLRKMRTSQSPWQTQRRSSPPLPLTWAIRLRMKIRCPQAPSESPPSSRQLKHPKKRTSELLCVFVY